nr:hypothetical protein CFP56_56583 [Quercus suber]
MLLLGMVQEMLITIGPDALTLASRVWTGYLATVDQCIEMFLYMLPQCLLSIKQSRTMFDSESLIPETKQTLLCVTKGLIRVSEDVRLWQGIATAKLSELTVKHKKHKTSEFVADIECKVPRTFAPGYVCKPTFWERCQAADPPS